MKRLHYRLLASVIALATVVPAQADAIRLKASVRLAGDGESIRLSDVAELEGPEAIALGSVVVARLADPASAQEISLRSVRAALEDAGAHWGRVNLSGGDVVVRPRRRTAAAPVAMTGVSLDGAGRTKPGKGRPAADDQIAATILNDGTLRATLAREIIRSLGAAPDSVRIIFDVADRTHLALRADAHRFEIQAEDRLSTDRATVLVRVWTHDRVTERFRITFSTLINATTAVLRHGLDRGDPVTAADFDFKTQWLKPVEARLACPPADAIERVATRRLEAGSIIRHKHVQPPVVIERGQRVTVRCLVGGTVISLQAEALADGAAGETIEFKKLGERSTFLASVTAPGEAIVDLSR